MCAGEGHLDCKYPPKRSMDIYNPDALQQYITNHVKALMACHATALVGWWH